MADKFNDYQAGQYVRESEESYSNGRPIPLPTDRADNLAQLLGWMVIRGVLEANKWDKDEPLLDLAIIETNDLDASLALWGGLRNDDSDEDITKLDGYMTNTLSLLLAQLKTN